MHTELVNPRYIKGAWWCMPVTLQVGTAGSGAQHHSQLPTEFKVSLDNLWMRMCLKSMVILSTYQLGILLLLYMICVWHVCVVMYAVHMCMITEQLWSSFFPPTFMKVLKDQTQIIRLICRHLYPLSHLASPQFSMVAPTRTNCMTSSKFQH